MVILFLFFSSLLFHADSSVSPCDHKISLTKASIENEKGVIEISINTSNKFICTLNIEKGTGLEKVSEKNGAGNSTIKFTNLSNESIYLVQVEFLDTNTPRCRILQLSQIVIE